MGCHSHEFDHPVAVELLGTEEDAALPAFFRESEFEFYSRRALEEARLAQIANNPAAADAHRYLAAAYSEQLAKHIRVHAELEELLSALL